jgi:hypothetical protein
MSSKGYGISSADVGVFTNHQSPKKQFKLLRWFNGFNVKKLFLCALAPLRALRETKKLRAFVSSRLRVKK